MLGLPWLLAWLVEAVQLHVGFHGQGVVHKFPDSV